jgi:hypothetical protein
MHALSQPSKLRTSSSRDNGKIVKAIKDTAKGYKFREEERKTESQKKGEIEEKTSTTYQDCFLFSHGLVATG